MVRENVSVLFSGVDTLTVLQVDSKLLNWRFPLMDWEFQYPPGSFIAADIPGILVIQDLIHLAKP